jgi:NAD dependent epimerase/dehydratase family enzyme
MPDAPPKPISPRHIVIGGVGSERSSILLRGQLVRPKRTLESGYVFRYPELRPALADLVHMTI